MCCSKKGHFTWEKIVEEGQIEYSPRGKKQLVASEELSNSNYCCKQVETKQSCAVALLKFGSEMGK